MPAARRAFIYAKSCGIFARSLLFKRSEEIAALTSLDAFAALLRREMAEPAPPVHGEPALLTLERMIREHTDKQISRLLSLFSAGAAPPPLLAALARKQEAAGLSQALAALAAGETECPPQSNQRKPCSRRGCVHFDAYPDMRGMLKGSPYASLLALQKKLSLSEKPLYYQAELEKAYWNYVYSALENTPFSDRVIITKMIHSEIALQNAVWALRLRVYYNFDAEETQRFFVRIKPAKNYPSVDYAARQSLSYDTGHYAAWQHWKYASFLNPEMPGQIWQADPRFFQNNAALYLTEMARKSFHRQPFTLDSAACFIYLKRAEERALTGISEALALGIPPAEVLGSFRGKAAA
ncbi:MAG: V-type ATPase subunit [Spirochaetaceae bacterium]|jgi:hypothetical protein|nr:V-type ATPase subunit [Spirochaetaceae bacterium]